MQDELNNFKRNRI